VTLQAEAFRRPRQRKRFIQPRISLANCATTLLANSSAMSASVQNATTDALSPAEVAWNVRLKSRKMRKIRLSTHCLLLFVSKQLRSASASENLPFAFCSAHNSTESGQDS
jgi:hypothetical protein